MVGVTSTEYRFGRGAPKKQFLVFEIWKTRQKDCLFVRFKV